MEKELLKNKKTDQYFTNIYQKQFLPNNKILKTDNKNYLIIEERETETIWLWTKNNLDNDTKKEITKELINKNLLQNKSNIICKKELYDYLITNKIKVKGQLPLKMYICSKIKNIKQAQGFFNKANYSDKIILSKYYQNNLKETKNIDIEISLALEIIANYLKQECIYVFRNSQGLTTAMATITLNGNQALITNVYTKKESRLKGYCTSLMYNLTKILLEKNLVPILITDYDNISANKVYQKVGYQEQEILINITNI